jgi:hypothetical protein
MARKPERKPAVRKSIDQRIAELDERKKRLETKKQIADLKASLKPKKG